MLFINPPVLAVDPIQVCLYAESIPFGLILTKLAGTQDINDISMILLDADSPPGVVGDSSDNDKTKDGNYWVEEIDLDDKWLADTEPGTWTVEVERIAGGEGLDRSIEFDLSIEVYY